MTFQEGWIEVYRLGQGSCPSYLENREAQGMNGKKVLDWVLIPTFLDETSWFNCFDCLN